MGYWLETLKYLRTERIQENYSMNDKRNAKVIKNDKNDKRYLKWNKKTWIALRGSSYSVCSVLLLSSRIKAFRKSNSRVCSDTF